MPYAANSDLPARVRSALPEHAQGIFRAAFNHAWSAHEGESEREEIAHRIAWAAVKRHYVKGPGGWAKRAGEPGAASAAET